MGALCARRGAKWKAEARGGWGESRSKHMQNAEKS